MQNREDRVDALFEQAMGLPEAQRKAFLRRECAGDQPLLEILRRLLAEDESVPVTFLGGDITHRLAGFERFESAGGDDTLPQFIGSYRILSEIGRGGMGRVYEAEQDSPRRRVAIKIIQSAMVSPQQFARFRREAEALGRLQHPGIAHIYEANIESTGESRPFFAMELIHGLPIDGYAKEHDLDPRGRLELIARVCDAVDYAHQQGVLHRDLKPHNILVEEGGQPKILDFGVSRITNADVHTATLQTLAGQLIGTIPYMSPEQVSGDPEAIDQRSDVYALGVVLFELLAGRLPYDLTNRPIPEAVRIIQEQDPSRLSSLDRHLRGDIDTIVSKALEKEKKRRYQTVADLAADIRRYLDDQPLVARPASTFYQLRKFAHRNRVLVGGIVATMLAITVGAGFAVSFAIESARHANEAELRGAQALEREAAANRNAYRATITAVYSAIESGNLDAAVKSLEAAQPELRGWEWRHLNARLDPVLSSFDTEPAPTTANDQFATRRCAFLPDGTPVVAIARKNAIQIIDMLTGVERIRIPAEGAALPTLSPNGALLAALENEALTVWDAMNGERMHRLAVDTSERVFLRFSRDARRLAIADEAHVRVFETASGAQVCGVPFASADDLDLSADGSSFVAMQFSLGKNRISRVDTESGAILADMTMPADAQPPIVIAPDGSMIAQATSDGSGYVRLWDTETLKEFARLSRHRGAIDGLAWSQDGGRLASLSGAVLVVWDVAARRPLLSRRVEAAQHAKFALQLSPDGSLVTIAGEGSAILVGLQESASTVLTGHKSFVYLATFNADGDTIASLDFSGEYRLWDAHSGEPIAVLPVPWFLNRHVTPMTVGFTADGLGVIASMRAWTASGEWGPLIDDPVDLAAHQDGWFRGYWLPEALGRENFGFVAGPNRDWVIGRDRSQIVSTDSGRQLVDLGNVYGKDLSPDATRLVVGQQDGAFAIWDTIALERITLIRGHSSYVHDVAFSPDGTQVVSASGDYTLRIWDALPPRERAARARRDERQRAALRPRIEALLVDHDAVAAFARFVQIDDPNPDELRAARRLLLLNGLENWQPPALHGLPTGGAGVVARYDAHSVDTGEPPNPASEAGGGWMWAPSLGDITGGPHTDRNGDSAWRIRRATPTRDKTVAWYACSVTPQVVAAAKRQGWRLRARIRLAPDSLVGFDLGYLADGRFCKTTIAHTADESQWINHPGDVWIPFPVDGEFHDVELVMVAGARLARVLLDGETIESMVTPGTVTNDPLVPTGSIFLRGEPTDAVIFGLAANAEPGSVDVQVVEFEVGDAGD